MKRTSTFVSLVAVFAAFSIVCDSFAGPLPEISGVWYSWIFVAEPISGIILTPSASFFSTLIGVMVGHSIYVRDPAEFLFTLGAPIGAMISSLIFRKRWKPAIAFYSVLIGAFFITPVSWQLPLWAMWDVYLAFGLLIISTVLAEKLNGFWETESVNIRLLYTVAVCTLIGLEADVLFRIFVLVPCQTYWIIYGWNAEMLQIIWVGGAVETSVKAALSILIGLVVTPSLVRALRGISLTALDTKPDEL